MGEGIAIVGMACRYPDARNPGELWETVLARRRAFRRMPPERLRLADYLPAEAADAPDPDSVYPIEAAVLEGYEFDRVAFRVAGDTFRSADLAHWLALDVAAEALADAGFPGAEGLPRDGAGVLLGNTLTGELSRAHALRLRWPYVRRVIAGGLAAEGWAAARLDELLCRLEAAYKAPFPAPMEETLAGGLSNTIAGRICNHFDLHGGGYTLDGACASSLLAVANACSALAAGDLDVALAGGVDLSLDPFELVGFARLGALAPGEMRVFDARSSGFLPGEGCGFVVLLREAEAARRGCRVRAVIRGWGISSDGQGGISRPEAEGQKLALRRAYHRSGFGIETVAYFEGHGTGTVVGDAAELAALSSARRDAAPAAPPAAIGSIKANIGHTKAAAGVAGLIKAALAVEAQVIPPTTGCEEPHAELRNPDAALRVLEHGEPWPADLPLRAAVSAMGFGGINCHVVVDGDSAARRHALTGRERVLLASWQDAELLLLAAADAGTLLLEVERLAERVDRHSGAELADLAAVLARRLKGGPARAAVVAARPGEAAERLRAIGQWLRAGETARLDPHLGAFLGVGARGRRLGFLFPGQGVPSHLDGGALRWRFPALQAFYTPAGLVPQADPMDTAVAQPAIIAHALAGLWLLDRLGLRAAVAVGHSLGEIAALHWGGALDAWSALRLAAVRGQAMSNLCAQNGAMASLGADAATTSDLIGADEVVIAAYNGPRRTVISGRAAAVDAVIERAQRHGVAASRLRVSHAFHSPAMEPAGPLVAAGLAALPLRPLARRVASTVTGGRLGPRTDLRRLLRHQLTSPVRFTAAIDEVRDRADLWIEVGPGRALTELAGELLDRPVLPLDVGGPSIAGLLAAAGAAYVFGARLDATALFEGRFTRPLDPERPLRFLANPCEEAPVVVGARHAVPLQPQDQDVRTLVRQLVAERAELPPDVIADDRRLLADLHLNSIAVGQLVVEASRRLGLVPPSFPTDYAQATVAELAEAMEHRRLLGDAGSGETAGAPAGVGSWVRSFTVELVRRDLADRESGTDGAERGWRVIAPPGHPLAAALAGRLPGAGVALCLPADPDERHAGLFVAAARAALAAPRPVRFALVQQSGLGGAFARTLHLELPATTTCVVDVPSDRPEAAAWVAREIAAATGYVEAHYDAEGMRRVPVLRLAPPSGGSPRLPLDAGDVLLATGGGKGIAAECGLDLAAATGARLALIGRSRPAQDAELAANLERLAAAGVRALYVAADVTDAAALRAAVVRVEAELGPVTALLHGAGTNAPRPLAALDEESFRRTLGPKVAGWRNLLSALDPSRLRLVISFGSIIARTGLPGEADYAFANEWLARATEGFARQHPDCRCLAVEWSVWAGLGMGEKLGTLESLVAQGISPIPAEIGVAQLRALISRPRAAVSVVVTGRFGEPPTLEVERPELPLLRYLEKPRFHVPGVELVVDAEVSADTDPHLADHVFHGEPLFAAVLGLEAMAQAAMAVVGTQQIPIFEEVAFSRPVAVPSGGSTTLRVAALVRQPGTVEVALRDAATGFAADHFRAVCRFDATVATADAAPRLLAAFSPAAAGEPVPLDPHRDLYGGPLFHRGRFRRVQGYRRLRATECLADISPDGDASWFGRYLPDRLVLGDPGARDAAIHGIQACIPHAALLPVGVDRIVTLGLESNAPLLLAARERSRQGDELVYDLEVLTRDGKLRERWEGLRLRAVERLSPPESWTAPLLAPHVERRLQEILPGTRLQVTLGRTAADDGLRHRPDGKPESADGLTISRSHAGDLTLTVTGDGRVGCDLEPVAARSAEVWRDLLGAERYRLAELIARERGEDQDAAATRVWAAAESLAKAGARRDAPLVLDRVAEDGWLLLRSGELHIGTLVAPVRELSGSAALAVLVESRP